MPTSQYNTNGRIVERVGLRLQVERVELRLHARAKLHEESGTRARETKLPLPNLTLMVLAYSGTCLFGQSKHHSHRGYLLGRVKPEFCLTGTTRPFGAGYFVVYTFDTPTHEHAPTHQHAPPTPHTNTHLRTNTPHQHPNLYLRHSKKHARPLTSTERTFCSLPLAPL